MTNEELAAAQCERMTRLIRHWCPENLLYEGFPNTLMRAFMAATACAADQKRVLDGKQPIRPLDSHPDPMAGFHNTPTGFLEPDPFEPQKVIMWSPPKLKKFKRAYKAAVGTKADTFNFEGDEFVVGYAKYLIEYLETQVFVGEIDESSDAVTGAGDK